MLSPIQLDSSSDSGDLLAPTKPLGTNLKQHRLPAGRNPSRCEDIIRRGSNYKTNSMPTPQRGAVPPCSSECWSGGC